MQRPHQGRESEQILLCGQICSGMREDIEVHKGGIEGLGVIGPDSES